MGARVTTAEAEALAQELVDAAEALAKAKAASESAALMARGAECIRGLVGRLEASQRRLDDTHAAIKASGPITVTGRFYGDPTGGRAWWQADGELFSRVEDAVMDAAKRQQEQGGRP